jgi:hypothetical protein
MYLVLMLKSRRFVEYFPPVAILFCAFAARGLLETLDWAAIRHSSARLTIVASISLLLLWSCWTELAAVRKEVASSSATDTYRGGAEWLATHTPAGATVFHTDWDDFPMLFFFNTHNTYLVGLDPDFMRLKNERLFHKWETISRGEVPDFEEIIQRDFGCEYIFTDNKHQEFLARAQRNPRMAQVYRDAQTTIFKILASPESPHQ